MPTLEQKARTELWMDRLKMMMSPQQIEALTPVALSNMIAQLEAKRGIKEPVDVGPSVTDDKRPTSSQIEANRKVPFPVWLSRQPSGTVMSELKDVVDSTWPNSTSMNDYVAYLMRFEADAEYMEGLCRAWLLYSGEEWTCTGLRVVQRNTPPTTTQPTTQPTIQPSSSNTSGNDSSGVGKDGGGFGKGGSGK